MKMIRRVVGIAGILSGCAMILSLGSSAHATEDNGFVTKEVTGSADEVVARIQAGIEERGLNQVAVVNHSAILAKAVNADLRATQVILFDNASVDAALLDNNPTFGIDLPQKILVHEAEDGSVHLTYSNMNYLGERHGIASGSASLVTASSTLSQLAADAAGEPDTQLPRTGVDSTSQMVTAVLLIAGGAGLLLWRRRILLVKAGLPALLIGSVLFTFGPLGTEAEAELTDGLVTVDSQFGVEETLYNVRTEAEARNFKVALTITHTTSGAPIRLITFGRPDLNVELLSANQTVGLDLPQKMLIWEDASGVHITYNDESYIADRHGITSKGAVVQELEALFGEIASAAATS